MGFLRCDRTISKESGIWVPQMQTPDQNLIEMEILLSLMALFQADPVKFFRKIMTRVIIRLGFTKLILN